MGAWLFLGGVSRVVEVMGARDVVEDEKEKQWREGVALLCGEVKGVMEMVANILEG